MKRYRIKRGVKSVEAASSEEALRIAIKDKKVHISAVHSRELRAFLQMNGVDAANMTSLEVRLEYRHRYGSWFLVGL